MDPVFLILVALIVILVVALAIVGQKARPGQRGAEPGKGHHILQSDYQSGVGGGHSTTWRVPKDPQDYAKTFVPKGKRK